MIIDVHYHVGTKKFGPYDFAIDKQWLREEMGMSDIQKTIVFPYQFPGSYETLNHEILDVFADDDILPFARLRLNFKKTDCMKYLTKIRIDSPLKRIARVFKEIDNRRCIATYGDEAEEKSRFTDIMDKFRGIKFHDNQDGHLTEEHFEFLLSFRKPIVLHINPFKLDYFLSLFANSVQAPLVIAHLGAPDSDSIYLVKTREILQRYDFLFTDTAAHVCSNHLVPFLQEVPEKVLFGSDGPVINQGSTRCYFQQGSRALFNDKDKWESVVEQSTADFCGRSGWTF